MKNIPFFLVILLCVPFVLWAQNEDNSAETIQFPTIKNDETIDLEDLLPQKEVKSCNDSNTQQSRKFSFVAGKSTSFYTDIIIGGVVLLLGFMAWYCYQKIGQQSEKG